MKDDLMLIGIAAVVTYIGARLLNDQISHHATTPLGALIPGLAAPACTNKCKAACTAAGTCVDAGCGKSIKCTPPAPKPVVPKPPPSPLGAIVPALNPKPAAPKPTAASFLPNQGVFAGAPLPNSRAAKTPVPPKTPTTPTLPNIVGDPTNPLQSIVPGLNPLIPLLNDRHLWFGPSYPAQPAIGFTQTLQIKNDFGKAGLNPINIYSSGANDANPFAYKEAEIIFLSTNGPQDLTSGGIGNQRQNNVTQSGGNVNLKSLNDGIYATINGVPTHKFNATQQVGHTYTTRYDTKTRTFTLTDHTAGTTETFVDKNPANQMSDQLVFDPFNEYHTGAAPGGPSHVRYDIQSLDNKIILPSGQLANPSGTPTSIAQGLSRVDPAAQALVQNLKTATNPFLTTVTGNPGAPPGE
jgi:hypothetical protein